MTDLEALRASYDDLAALSDACPAVGSRWRHYKTQAVYVVVGNAISEAMQAPLVIYRPAGVAVHFARPLVEWHETVEHGGEAVPRFAPEG